MDSLKYNIVFDITTVNFSQITDGKMTFSNVANQTGREVYMNRFKSMSLTNTQRNILGELTVKFINKTDGKAFDLQSDDTKVRFV